MGFGSNFGLGFSGGFGLVVTASTSSLDFLDLIIGLAGFAVASTTSFFSTTGGSIVLTTVGRGGQGLDGGGGMGLLGDGVGGRSLCNPPIGTTNTDFTVLLGKTGRCF